MKAKFYLVMAAVALLMTNCSQDESVSQSKGGTNTLTATVEGASRSAVTDAGVFSWTDGDAIAVGNENGGYTKFTHGTNGSFSAETSIVPTSYAIYPYNEAYTFLPETGLPTVTLASSYNYGSTNAPMLAEVSGNTLQFKHLGGIMRFVVKDVPNTATSFTFTANSGITGEFELTQNSDGENIISAETATNDNKTVTINFTSEDIKDVMTFYIPLPTGTYSGYTVSVGGKLHTTEATVVNTISRGTLMLMPTFTYDEYQTNLVKGEDNMVVLNGNEDVSLTVADGEKVTVAIADNVEATLNLATPENTAVNTVNISDGSAENTESMDESAGTLNVAAEDVSTLNINTPTLTVKLTSGNYEKVEALTAQQTLIIGEGVTIDELVIDGGNVEISGNVKKITNNVVATVTVTKNITLTAPIEIANDNTMLTFDLGTYNVKNTTTSGNTDGLIINASSSLTIEGSTGGTLETATGGDGFPVIALGTVVINGGVFKSYVDGNNKGNACIYAKESGNVTVNGGEFYAGAGEYGYDYVLNVKDADRATASITAKGGTFHNFNPAYCKTEGDPTNFLASDCVSLCIDATTNTWKVEKMSESAIGQAFANGGSFTMTQDVYLGQALTVPAEKTLSLTLAGFDVIAPNTDALVAEGTLTITGDENSVVYAGSDPSKTGSVCAVWANGGKVTINGGHYKVGQDKNGKRNDCIYAGYNAENKGGQITINNGKFEFVWGSGNKNYTNNYNGDQFLLNCADKAVYTASITVNGGSFKNYAPSYESVTPSGRTENEIKLGTEKAVYKGNANVTAAHGHGTAEDAWYEVK